MTGSLLAEIVPTWAISSFLETGRGDVGRQLLDGGLDGLLDPPADGRRVGARGDDPQAFAEDRAGQDGGGGGAVAGDVRRLRRHDVDELGAHVLERVGQLDLLGDRDAVLGDGRAAERLAEDHVAAGRPERGADGVGQNIDAFEHLAAGGVGEEQLLGHGVGSYVRSDQRSGLGSVRSSRR